VWELVIDTFPPMNEKEAMKPAAGAKMLNPVIRSKLREKREFLYRIC
jgi:hypothetical protein